MSTTLSGQLDASTATLQADLGKITSGVAELQAELATAMAGVTPGTTITQAQVTALQNVATSLDTLAAGLPQPAPAAPPAPAPAPAAPPAPASA